MLAFYRAWFKIMLLIYAHYRIILIIGMTYLFIRPLIYMAIWSSVATTSGGEVNGFTVRDFAAYYIVFMLVNYLTQDWHMSEFEEYIWRGDLSNHLLRPLHPIHHHIAENLAYKTFELFVLVPVGIILTVVFEPKFQFTLLGIVTFVPVLILAGALTFLINYNIAMGAFWTTRINAFIQIYYVALLFFSGQLVPLKLMSLSWQSIANVLPFRWMLAFPTELLLGYLDVRGLLEGVAIQIVWIVTALGTLNLLWRAGVKRYSAVGV